MEVPGDGFRYLMAKPLRFQQYFKILTLSIFASRGLYAYFDNKRIANGHALWANKVARWRRDLDKRRDGVGKPDGELSDLKLAGSLLWALNKVQPISDIRPLTREECNAFNNEGINAVENYGNIGLFECYYNEAPIFLFVHHVFCSMELARPEEHRVDFENPPLTRHFLRNFCFMLREESPSPLELYMVFKAFDLYGVVHNN